MKNLLILTLSLLPLAAFAEDQTAKPKASGNGAGMALRSAETTVGLLGAGILTDQPLFRAIDLEDAWEEALPDEHLRLSHAREALGHSPLSGNKDELEALVGRRQIELNEAKLGFMKGATADIEVLARKADIQRLMRKLLRTKLALAAGAVMAVDGGLSITERLVGSAVIQSQNFAPKTGVISNPSAPEPIKTAAVNSAE